ncbi:MAG TPA: PIN domain-containing protein [Candidatus Acidoferrum sp.]|jgi:predicted nucleic acid-binding protein
MDRLFLDANVLFSAAYRANAGLLQFWKLKNVALCSSQYALEEARINLAQDVQKHRLDKLASAIEFFDSIPRGLPRDVVLPDKDLPILLAAIAARSTILITGDVHHFGRSFGKTIEGMLVLSPADYLRRIGL